MDLIVSSYWKGNGETFRVVRYPNTNYKNLEDLQKTLMRRFRNKKIYWVNRTWDGIIMFNHHSPIAIETTLGE